MEKLIDFNFLELLMLMLFILILYTL